MKSGIPVDEAAHILNVSTNYVYRLIREEKLEVVSLNPINVTSRSVVKRLMKLTPFLQTAMSSRLDYAVRQRETVGW